MSDFPKTEGNRAPVWERSVWLGGAVFLVLNCSARLGVLFTSSSLTIQALGIAGIALCFIPLFKPSWLKAVLFCFALTFPLYGSLPYSTHSYLFELYLSFIALMLLIKVYKDGSLLRVRGLLQSVLFLYGLLSCGSILLLPVQNMGWQLVLWDWDVFWNAVYFSTPELPLYSFSALNRLILYILCAILLSSCQKARELYRVFFAGLLASAFWASVVGIFEYYKFLDLAWFREVAVLNRLYSGPGIRLRSVFANSGWFAEFLASTIPYILLGFITLKISQAKRVSLLGILIVCEVAIILTYSRTAWIIFPFVLLTCWFFFFIATRADTGRLSWKQVGKMIFQVAASVSLTLCVGYFLIVYVFGMVSEPEIKESSKFRERISQIINPSVRKVIWEESLGLVKEKPLFGLGYESFKQHNSILKKVKKKWDTPHNLYFQLLVSGGVVGLTFWGMLIFATLFLLVADLVKNKTYLNIAVISSIVAFHLYGFTQAMQYIPMIWFLIFVNIGYAITIHENVLPDWIRRQQTAFTLMLLLVVMVGISVYASDFESRKLAAKEKLIIYSLDQDQNKYLGFYPAERWGEKGVYRWTGSEAVIKLPRAETFELTLVCTAPDLTYNPLVVSVYEDDNQIDEISFFKQDTITRHYFIPDAGLSDKKLYFRVSRTWNLKKLGIANDSRSLGVAISELKVIMEIPPDGIGFYRWEVWKGKPLPGKTGDQFYYRWTGREAVFNPQQLGPNKHLYFRAGQPGLPDNPLVIQIWQKKKIVQSLQLADTEWHRVTLQTLTDQSEPFIIKVDRSWNPRSIGLGEDTRTLGVAVAGLRKANELK